MLVWLTLCLTGLVSAVFGLKPLVAFRPPGSSTRSAASPRYLPLPQRPPSYSCTFEQLLCSWTTSPATRVVTGQEVNNSWVPHPRVLPPGPFVDASNNTHGHFLYTYVKNASGAKEVVLKSQRFLRTAEKCRVEVSLHMSNMVKGYIKLVIEGMNRTSWVTAEKEGNNLHAWTLYSFSLGKIRQEFNIILEIVPANKYPYHIAIDNIFLVNCFPDPPQNICSSSQFQCTNGSCIDSTKICNINKDCPNGEDEDQNCTSVPIFARCTFESGLCGWHNAPGNLLNWTKNNGSTATSYTGPNFDHTFQNNTGVYLYVDMTGKLHELGTAAALESPIINPPPQYHSNSSSPYYNSCFITFHYHKYGPHSGSLGLFLIELQRNNNVSTKLWWSYGDKGEKWLMQVVTLPNITHNRYYLQFEARKSFASRGDPAIDDITMSPRCFGLGVPESDLNGYVYNKTNFTTHEPPPLPPVHQDFLNATVFSINTCGKNGRTGPTQENCTASYNNTNVQVSVLTDRSERGIQRWTVPETGFYTIFAKGASGGKGSDAMGSSYGAIVRGVVELTQGQHLFILVGQKGKDACRKAFASSLRIVCKQGSSRDDGQPRRQMTPLEEIINLSALPEGGGGGGATYIFTWHRKKEKEVLLVAGGGGGISHASSQADTFHNGHDINTTLLPTTGDAYGRKPAGAGGGWLAGNFTYRDVTGLSLLQGGTGGKACYTASDGSDKGAGGFGGGGGGCTAGGGGGGYTGGRAWGDKSAVGEGGYSWVGSKVFMPRVWLGQHKGDGEVIIVPALSGACNCDYRCLAMDMYRSKTKCICPSSWLLSNDSTSCVLLSQQPIDNTSFSVTIFLIVIVVILILFIFVIFIILYNNYQKKKAESIRRKMASGPDLQLNRLRGASDGMVTEFNPNYEFAGAMARANDLNPVPRERLRLIKALGQGAFGEVYQGFFKNRAGDAVEMPVAVKTLPELSTNQNENDFWMEARIMSKFDHPNIVHFIGVCFDRHPRYIVIELLAGGDLKTFLREHRPKPERASTLTMKDLVSCVVDVAKGCKYLADCRFIHRDIAARNCLLTTKGPGRVVKIADFGMARDIYRQDYYKKGGKAMLPIKWMPPEAFLDGLFTSKTDVWSFGVLTWEVMSLGYMPYTGCANREVMQLVTSGGRLEPPTNCPPQIYAIMTQCWHPNPDERPPFARILERLGYCTQDPDVMKASLPVYTNPPSAERDQTVMRPRNDPLQPDYLIPLPGGTVGTTWPSETRQSQPLLTPPLQDKHPRIFTVSHNIKQDTAEITC